MRLVIAIPLLSALAASPASADAITTYTNTTQVIGSDGNSYSNIGADFQTTGLTVSVGANSLTLDFNTLYNGGDSVDGMAVPYSDIFLGAAGTTNYSFAIALGTATSLGGLGAGLYQIGGVATSQQLFANLPNIVYGQGYVANGAVNASPVLVTSGTQLTGAVSSYYGNNDLHIVLSGLNGEEMQALEGDFSLYWGTAICGNGGFYISQMTPSSSAPVPEPATFGMLAVFAAGAMGFAKRRTRMPSHPMA